MAILESPASHPEGVSARQVSQTTQLNLSTCCHLRNALAASGYALNDAWSLLYRPTGKIGFTAQGRCTLACLLAQLTQHAQSPQDATRETAYRTAFPPLVQEAARAATRNLLILGWAGLSRPL